VSKHCRRFAVAFISLWLICPLASLTAGGSGVEPSRILWTEPSAVESRDLFYGIGGESGAPDATHEFEYIKGKQKKLLRDSRGRIWEIRKNGSSRAEITSQRILWALGYHSDQEYFVATARIKGQNQLSDVALKLLNSDFRQKGTWSWASNPFVNSKELEGLLAVMLLINNLALDDKNNEIAVDSPAGTEIYYISQINSAFGGCGGVFKRDGANPSHYAKSTFIDKTKDGYIYFHCKVLNTPEPARIKIESGKWISLLLGELSDSQLLGAFKAGNFTSSESEAFVRAMRLRIGQLQTASSQ
jgi:hypothetical protein